MRKLMKKKVNVLGKEISVFAIALIAVTGLASAALIPYFAQITGMVTVTQGLTWDGAAWDDELFFDFNGDEMTSLDEKTFSSTHYLENEASDSDAVFDLTSVCKDGGDADCDENIVWWYEYILNVAGNPGDGDEKRVTIIPTDSFDELDELNSIEWTADVAQGYLPHVDVILDNGKTLTFEYDKIRNCGVGAYPTGEGLDTFDDKGIVDSTAYAWTDIPGPCGDANFIAQWKTLSEWKTEYLYAKILRIEVEVDNWIPSLSNPQAVVSHIKINGNEYEASGLEAGKKLDFDFKVYFPKMLYPDDYTITTEVLPR